MTPRMQPREGASALASQKAMVLASLGATHRPDVYQRRPTSPAPRTGAPTAAAARHAALFLDVANPAGDPSSPAIRAPRVIAGAPGGSPSTTATSAGQG